MSGRTVGGNWLRRLREQCGLTQQEMYLRDVIAAKTLSQIETGKTERPDRETVEGLLDAYDARFDDRKGVLQSFGYMPDYRPPKPEEIARVLEWIQPALDDSPFPAYIIDFTTKLWFFNDLYMALLRLEREEIASFHGQPLWKLLFEDALPADDDFETAVLDHVQQTRERLAIFVNEPWFEEMLNKECDAQFLRYWHEVGEMTQELPASPPFSVKTQKPVVIDQPGLSHLLYFHVNEERITGDERIAVVWLIPADDATIEWVNVQKAGT